MLVSPHGLREPICDFSDAVGTIAKLLAELRDCCCQAITLKLSKEKTKEKQHQGAVLT